MKYSVMKEFKPVCRVCGTDLNAKHAGLCLKCRCVYDKEVIRLTKMARKRAYYTTWKKRVKKKGV